MKKNMTTQDLQFQINQLRMDKIIFGVEACAVSLLVIILVWGSFILEIFVPPVILDLLLMGSILVASGVTIYVLISNYKRFTRIKKLQKILSSQELS